MLERGDGGRKGLEGAAFGGDAEEVGEADEALSDRGLVGPVEEFDEGELEAVGDRSEIGIAFDEGVEERGVAVGDGAERVHAGSVG